MSRNLYSYFLNAVQVNLTRIYVHFKQFFISLLLFLDLTSTDGIKPYDVTLVSLIDILRCPVTDGSGDHGNFISLYLDEHGIAPPKYFGSVNFVLDRTVIEIALFARQIRR